MADTSMSEAAWEKLLPHVLKRGTQLVSDYSVPMFLENRLAGSGTLIKCGRIHGILTAHHVVHNPHDPTRKFDFKAGSSQTLLLVVEEFAHRLEIQTHYLSCVDVGVPVDEYFGPDLTVLVIPDSCPQFHEIKARKRFFDISIHRAARLTESLSNNGCWFLVGNPQALEETRSGSHGFSHVVNSRGIAAYTYVAKREEVNAFDFMHLGVERSKLEGFTEHFGGMSGGGVWKIPLVTRQFDAGLTIQLGDEVLAGVAFYQTAMRDGGCEIRCHAARSVYEKVYEVLSKWESQHRRNDRDSSTSSE